jgi:hypothetical protein
MAILTRWGHSNGGIRIPQAILTAGGLRVGDDLSVRLLDNGSILLTPRKGPIAVSGNQTVRVAPAKPATQEEMLAKW